MLIRVLLVVDDEQLEQRLDGILSSFDAAIAVAPASAPAEERVRAFPADLIVISRAACRGHIESTIADIRSLPGCPEAIVVCEPESTDERARLLVAGCTAVVNRTLSDELLREVFETFVSRQRAARTHLLQHQLDVRLPTFDDFTSSNVDMKAFVRVARRVAQSQSSLLVQGETGVGKERLARAIHGASGRAAGPFVPVTLAALPENLLEAELFGHAKGAFTGATSARRGCFELAHGGTLLLDEIGDLPQHLQVKLLRVLQERSLQRLGSENRVAVDVRVIAATNRNLLEETKAKRFREDLYYRLGVVTLDVPPLRKRPEDIPELLKRYIHHFRTRRAATATGFSSDALRALQNYSWPGNVRELINVVERAVLLAEGTEVAVSDLPASIAPAHFGPAAQPSALLDVLGADNWHNQEWKQVREATVAACERMYFVQQLTRSHGNLKQAAEEAGMNPKSLYAVMKRHGLEKSDFR